MVKARKYVYVKPFDGLPKKTDFEIQEEELPALNDGGITIFYLFYLSFQIY